MRKERWVFGKTDLELTQLDGAAVAVSWARIFSAGSGGTRTCSLHPPELPGGFCRPGVHRPPPAEGPRLPGVGQGPAAGPGGRAREEGAPGAHGALPPRPVQRDLRKAVERWLGHKLSSGSKEELPKLGAPWQGRRPPTAPRVPQPFHCLLETREEASLRQLLQGRHRAARVTGRDGDCRCPPSASPAVHTCGRWS